jgi:CO/xanthine dehydrogenase FAD-binding subunit
VILPHFDVLVPETVAEACNMLARHGDEGVRVLAGGTDLLVDLRQPIIPQHVPRCDGCPSHPHGQVVSTIECSRERDPLIASDGSLRAALGARGQKPPARLISLHKLSDLKGIETLADGRLRIGALTTITTIERSPEVRNRWEGLAEGADQLGSPLVRNRGTIGGNIVNARPAADMFVPTVALDGTLTLQGAKGSRTAAARDFPRGPGLSIIEPDEILTEIHYPAPRPHSASTYYKLANRKALEISMVGVAIHLTLDRPGGAVTDVRVALGAVAPKPIVAESVQDVLIGKVPDEALLRDAARAARDDARPIDDHRASAWYRVQMIETLSLRLLQLVLKRAQGTT